MTRFLLGFAAAALIATAAQAVETKPLDDPAAAATKPGHSSDGAGSATDTPMGGASSPAPAAADNPASRPSAEPAASAPAPETPADPPKPVMEKSK